MSKNNETKPLKQRAVNRSYLEEVFPICINKDGYTIYKAMERLPMVTVEFKSMPNFRCLLSEWKEIGGYKGFLKEYGISIASIKKVRTQVLKANEHPTQAWEG